MKRMKLNIQLFANGYVEFAPDGALQGKIEWNSSVASDGSNYSVVTVKLYARRTSGNPTFGSSWKSHIQIGEYEQTLDPVGYRSVGTSWVLMQEMTANIWHEANGTKTVYIFGWVEAPSGTSLAGRVSQGDIDAGLDNIPRATYCPNMSAYIDSAYSTAISPASNQFNHKLVYVRDNTETTLWTGGVGETNVQFTLPTSFYSYISTTSQYVIVPLKLYTYLNGGLTGTASANLTAWIAPSKGTPSITGAVFYDENDTTYALTSNRYVMVANKSRMSITPSVSYKPTQNPSVFNTLKINETYDGETESGTKTVTQSLDGQESFSTPNYTTTPRYSVGQTAHQYTISVTDSRGFTSASTAYTPTILKYYEPMLVQSDFLPNGGISFDRPQVDSNQILVTFIGDYWGGNFKSGNANTLTISFRAKENQGSWSNWVDLVAGTNFYWLGSIAGDEDRKVFGTDSTGGVQGTALVNPLSNDGTWNYLSTYHIELRLKDKLSEVVVTRDISSSIPIYDWWQTEDNEKYFQVNGHLLVGEEEIKNYTPEARNVFMFYGSGEPTITTEWYTFPFTGALGNGNKITLNGNQVVIGAGVSQIKVSAYVFLGDVENSGYIWGWICKNNEQMLDGITGSSKYFDSVCITDGIINVAQGDIISLQVNNPSYQAHSYLIRGGNQHTRMTIEVIK